MTPQELKNSILQLAIQGKLVEQRPEEGTASELYAQIQAEKQKLIKEGKLKKEKPLPEITEDEKPFDIPDGWMWVRLGAMIALLSGQDLLPAQYNNVQKGIPYITGASNIEGSNVILNRWTEFANAVAKKGDILLTCKGTVGKTAILKEHEVHIARQIMAITTIITDTQYIRYFIESQIATIKKHAKSMIPGIERGNVINLNFPLPPLAEQKRIVAKIEELLPLVDSYEQAWSKLEEFNKRFPTDMQKSLLQMAIQGKLVEQRPEEGTGEELYRQIQSEKQKLIKEGKLKKEKPLPEIKEEEKPYDIPDGWKWIRLGTIISISSGNGLKLNEMDINEKYPVYGGNGIAGYHASYNIEKPTLVIGRVGFYCGSTHITGTRAWITDNAFITTFNENRVDMKWLKYYIDYLEPRKRSSSTAQPVISGKLIYPLLITLPPLAEQKRIVERLEELLPLCKRLK